MFFKNIFNLSGKKENIDLNDSSLKKLARKTGIMYLKKNLKDKINSKFNTSCKSLVNNLKIISNHRGSNKINKKDLELLKDIESFLKIPTTDKLINRQLGGNYDGWCDNLPGQCTDSTGQCGGNYDGWCDNLPGQCTDSTGQCGGSYDGWCDNLPGQCTDSTGQCGGSSNLVNKYKFKNIIKKYLKNIKIDNNILDNVQRKIEKDLTDELLKSKNKSMNLNDIYKNFV